MNYHIKIYDYEHKKNHELLLSRSAYVQLREAIHVFERDGHRDGYSGVQDVSIVECGRRVDRSTGDAK